MNDVYESNVCDGCLFNRENRESILNKDLFYKNCDGGHCLERDSLNIKQHRKWDIHYFREDCKLHIHKMRCSEHCGNTVREAK
jgi:hypothetical protein